MASDKSSVKLQQAEAAQILNPQAEEASVDSGSFAVSLFAFPPRSAYRRSGAVHFRVRRPTRTVCNT
jgi:hypothetical protein